MLNVKTVELLKLGVAGQFEIFLIVTRRAKNSN